MAERDAERSDALSGPDGTTVAEVAGTGPDGVAPAPAVVSSEDAAGDGGSVHPESSVDGPDAEPAAPAREPDAPAAAPARPARRPADRQHSPGTPAAPATVGGVQYRPRIEAEPSILGLSRHTRGRFGARAFNLFFIGVFALILIQLIVALLNP